jgi:hypothetical protein
MKVPLLVCLCMLAEIYQCFRETCSILLDNKTCTLKIRTACFSETALNFYQTIWNFIPDVVFLVTFIVSNKYEIIVCVHICGSVCLICKAEKKSVLYLYLM